MREPPASKTTCVVESSGDRHTQRCSLPLPPPSSGSRSQSSALAAAGCVAALARRLVDPQWQVRLHALGALRNWTIALSAGWRGLFASGRGVVSALVACVAGAEAAVDAASAAGGGADAAAPGAGSSTSGSASGGAWEGEEVAKEVLLRGDVAEAALAVLLLWVQEEEEVVATVAAEAGLLLLRLLGLDVATAPTTPAALPRCRTAAARLLHAMTEHNEALAAAVRSTPTLAATLAAAATGDAVPEVRLHAAGALANVWLQPVVGGGGAGEGAVWNGAAVTAASQAVATAISNTLAEWSPMGGLPALAAAFEGACAALANVPETAGAALAAEGFVPRHDARDQEDDASGGGAGAGAGVTEAADDGHGGEGSDAEEDVGVGESAGAAAGSAPGGHDALGEEDDAPAVVVDDAVAAPAVNVHLAAKQAAAAAKAAYIAARRQWFAEAHRAALALEVLANVAGGEDEVQASGEGDEDAATGVGGAVAHAGDGDKAAAAGDLYAQQVPVVARAALRAAGVWHHVGAVMSQLAPALCAIAPLPEGAAALSSLPPRTRRSAAAVLITTMERALSATANVAASADGAVDGAGLAEAVVSTANTLLQATAAAMSTGATTSPWLVSPPPHAAREAVREEADALVGDGDVELDTGVRTLTAGYVAALAAFRQASTAAAAMDACPSARYGDEGVPAASQERWTSDAGLLATCSEGWLSSATCLLACVASAGVDASTVSLFEHIAGLSPAAAAAAGVDGDAVQEARLHAVKGLGAGKCGGPLLRLLQDAAAAPMTTATDYAWSCTLADAVVDAFADDGHDAEWSAAGGGAIVRGAVAALKRVGKPVIAGLDGGARAWCREAVANAEAFLAYMSSRGVGV